MSERSEQDVKQWVAWTSFIEQKNVRGVQIIFPTSKGKTKRFILPEDVLPVEINQHTILKCLYRPLTRNERRTAKNG